MAFNWSDLPIEGQQAKFDWDSHPVEDASKPDISQTESGLRGAAQGLSFGFADEATGAAEAALDWLKNDPQGFLTNYQKHRDESRQAYKDSEEANPKTYIAGQIGGAIAPALVTGGGSTAATIGELAAQGAAQGLGSSEADLTKGDVIGAARDTALGGTIGAVTGVAGKIPVGKIVGKVGEKIGDLAEHLAVNATGATGAQASKFADDAGRQLLDRGLVRFGDNAANIAQRTEGAVNAAHTSIDDALKALDAKGVTASVDNIISELEQKVESLSKDPSQAGLVRKLKSTINDIYETGESQIPISEAETTKRGFNKAAGNWMDPEAGQAGKTAYQAYRKGVEDVAEAADPALAAQFKEGKQTFGLLAPIHEAAEKRASQQSQSQIGSLSDWIAGGAGMLGGPKGAVASIAAKRLIAPRLAASGAVIANNLGKIVEASPQVFGKFAAPLQAAAQRGGTSLAAAHYVLSQQNPEYRELIKQIESSDEQK